jgi:hypothetical protein
MAQIADDGDLGGRNRVSVRLDLRLSRASRRGESQTQGLASATMPTLVVVLLLDHAPVQHSARVSVCVGHCMLDLYATIDQCKDDVCFLFLGAQLPVHVHRYQSTRPSPLQVGFGIIPPLHASQTITINVADDLHGRILLVVACSQNSKNLLSWGHPPGANAAPSCIK